MENIKQLVTLDNYKWGPDIPCGTVTPPKLDPDDPVIRELWLNLTTKCNEKAPYSVVNEIWQSIHKHLKKNN